MHRSSWIAVGIALAIVAGVSLALAGSGERSAPPMTHARAEDILRRARERLARNDTAGIMDLFAPDAKILGAPPDVARTGLQAAFDEIREGHLDIRWTGLALRPEQAEFLATFDLEVGQTLSNVDVTYFRSRMTMHLALVKVPQWLGLAPTEEWRIRQVESTEPFTFPDP